MDKNKLYFLSIVGIVALVGIVAMVSMGGTSYTVVDTVDTSDDTAIAGQAIRDRFGNNKIAWEKPNSEISITKVSSGSSLDLEQSCNAFLGGEHAVASTTLDLIKAEVPDEIRSVLAASVLIESLMPATNINDQFSASLAQSIQDGIILDIAQETVFTEIMGDGGGLSGDGFAAVFDWLLEPSLFGDSRLEVLVTVIVNIFFPAADFVIDLVNALVDVFRTWTDGVGDFLSDFVDTVATVLGALFGEWAESAAQWLGSVLESFAEGSEERQERRQERREERQERREERRNEREEKKGDDCFPPLPEVTDLLSSNEWLETYTSAQASSLIDNWLATTTTIGLTDNHLIVYGYITNPSYQADVIAMCGADHPLVQELNVYTVVVNNMAEGLSNPAFIQAMVSKYCTSQY